MWPLAFGCLIPSAIAAWTDFRSHRVPNLITIPMLFAGLAYGAYSGQITDTLIGALALFGAGFLCFVIGGMGGGDVKLLAALGAWFGLPDGIAVVLIASVFGIIWGLGKKIKSGELKTWGVDLAKSLYLRVVLNARGVINTPRLPDDITAPLPKEAIPFGTCLATAAWLVHFGGGWLV